MPDTRKEKIALVLQGGGALGSYQAGAYDALQRADFKIDWVAGISIGAINGAIICGNPPSLRAERLERFWCQTSSRLLASPVTGDETSLRLFNETSAAMTAAFGVPGFFEPRMPRGRNRSPGFQNRNSSGHFSLSASMWTHSAVRPGSQQVPV